MPIGTGSFIPQGQFASPRSYYRGIGFDIDGYTVNSLGHLYTWTKISNPNEVWTIALDVRFYNWSSNRWTLDHMVTDFYYRLLPDPTPHPQPYTLQPWIRPVTFSPYILFQFSNVDFNVFHWFDFPPAPEGYWLPPFPNG